MANAIDLPSSIYGPALKPTEPMVMPEDHSKAIVIPKFKATTAIPPEAKDMKFELKEIKVEGVTVAPAEIIENFYLQHLNKEVSLESIYKVADAITSFYRNLGYFIATAYVPDQSVKDGLVTIKVAEGYIGEVDFSDPISNDPIAKSYLADIIEKKPLKSSELESFLLRLNNIPGAKFRSVLSQASEAEAKEGAIKLTLVKEHSNFHASVALNNFNSRFLGPQQLAGNFSRSVAPFHDSSLSILSGQPDFRLKQASFDHRVMIAEDLILSFNTSAIYAKPGYSLIPQEIKVNSNYLKFMVEYQLIYQRDQSLSINTSIDARNNKISALSREMFNDHIRAFRIGMNYQTKDSYGGNNIFNISVSQGLEMLGSSILGQANLSRANADPAFRKAEMSYTRVQSLNKKINLVTKFSGQLASSTLYAAEGFSYGGQAFGKAYDGSDLSGDDGFSASAELQYQVQEETDKKLGSSIYGFYDMGVVWNEDVTHKSRAHASSAGIGTKNEYKGLSMNIGLAWPLTKPIATPIYGWSKRAPRIILEVSKSL